MSNDETSVPRVDQEHVISVLLEENKNINENKIYLLALIKQMKAEYDEAKAQWEAERASLAKTSEKNPPKNVT